MSSRQHDLPDSSDAPRPPDERFGHAEGWATGIEQERARIVAHLRKWHDIRESSPIARRWSSVIDGIEHGEHYE